MNTGTGMDNKPQFKIYGAERRAKKKELTELKFFIKGYWYWHQLDKDLAEFYNVSAGYLIPDDKARDIYDSTIEKIEKLEEELNIPYNEE